MRFQKIISCRFLLVAILLVFMLAGVVSTAATATRGVAIKARTATGQTRNIPLYSGYRALVIVCGAYRNGWPRLANPERDGREVAAALARMGFAVRTVTNPDSRQLRRALNDLAGNSDPNQAIFVYFAGHGHTLTRADNTKLGYIVPVDAPNPEKDRVGFMARAISMREIEEISTLIRAKHVLMAFDSCFSGSVFRSSPSVPSAYIREQVAEPVRQFITAGNENEQVPDESVFKTVLLQGLEKGYADRNNDSYVTGLEIGVYLQEEVVNYSEGAQHPQFGKIRNPHLDKGDFVFVTGSGAGSTGGSTTGQTDEYSQLSRERAQLEQERRELEELKKIAAERERLAAERRRLKAERTQLAMGSRPQGQDGGNLTPETNDLKPGSTYTDSTTGMEFMWVPGGCYQMGDTFGGGGSDEKPVHEVCVDGLYMGKYEVTQGEWRKVMGNNPAYFKKGDRYPVEQVSWNDAREFIRKLNSRSGKTYRLPTEAEWEYGARSGGKKEKYAGGNNVDSVAWYKANSGRKTHEVGAKSSNGLGIYDMSGNVWEWCQDWYGYNKGGFFSKAVNYYATSPRNNPRGPSSGSFRVFRGGSCYDFPRCVRAAFRNWYSPGDRSNGLGFRLVLPPGQEGEKF